MTDIPDNLDAATDAVANTLDPTINRAIGTPGAPVTKQILIRVSQHDADRWKAAADAEGVSVSDFIRVRCNAGAAAVLDCVHPAHLRRSYPWSEVCLGCGFRIR